MGLHNPVNYFQIIYPKVMTTKLIVIDNNNWWSFSPFLQRQALKPRVPFIGTHGYGEIKMVFKSNLDGLQTDDQKADYLYALINRPLRYSPSPK